MTSGVPAAAQTTTDRIEVWGAVTRALTGPTGQVVADYSPPLPSDGVLTSHGVQTLAIETRAAVGGTGGLNVFFTPHVAMQLLVDYASFSIGGSNALYAYSIHYTSRQPPDDLPVPLAFDQTIAWPDRSGLVRQIRIGLMPRSGSAVPTG